MSTKKCLKGLRKDKISGKCVSLEELKARQKRSKTLKKIDKIDKNLETFINKLEKARESWKTNIKTKKNGIDQTSKSNKKYKKLQKLENEYKKISNNNLILDKEVGDIEEKYNISQHDPY